MVEKDNRGRFDAIDRRFGVVEAKLKELAASIEENENRFAREAKDRHAAIVEAVRSERGATADAVDAGVKQASDVAESLADERVEALRDEVRAAFRRLSAALADA